MNPEILLDNVRQAVLDVDQYLSKHTFDQAQPGFPVRADLLVIRAELERVINELVTGRVPEKRIRTLSMGRIILDGSWKCDKEPLATKLLAISDAYNRKLA